MGTQQVDDHHPGLSIAWGASSAMSLPRRQPGRLTCCSRRLRSRALACLPDTHPLCRPCDFCSTFALSRSFPRSFAPLTSACLPDTHPLCRPCDFCSTFALSRSFPRSFAHVSLAFRSLVQGRAATSSISTASRGGYEPDPSARSAIGSGSWRRSNRSTATLCWTEPPGGRSGGQGHSLLMNRGAWRAV